MSVSINGTGGLTFSDSSVQSTAATGFGFKNRIINGAMMIDQRNAGASVTVADTGNNTYTLDRWAAYGSQASKFSVQRNAGSVTPPSGFTNYLGVNSLSAYSVLTSDIFRVTQFVEGFNAADLAWGTANAQTVTLSFWVRSSLTGTFGGSVGNSAYNRSFPFTYTVSSANTWEQKTVTIVGDTSGTWLTDSGIGIRVNFGLGVGSTASGTAGAWAASGLVSATSATSVVGTNGATFYITGVQLEKGSTATAYDYRPYGTELALCQRYYSVGDYQFLGYQQSGGIVSIAVPFKQVMRTAPTVTLTNVYRNGFSAEAVNSANVNTIFVRANCTATTASAEFVGTYVSSAEL